ncbi:hypothetical protein KSS87_005232 [Heliosperma pusillum]|nr:hypothetical protein KSS87_005232 [Heliosperma pusillum]
MGDNHLKTTVVRRVEVPKRRLRPLTSWRPPAPRAHFSGHQGVSPPPILSR